MAMRRGRTKQDKLTSADRILLAKLYSAVAYKYPPEWSPKQVLVNELFASVKRGSDGV